MLQVSIITPLHNKGPYVAETIRSVQAQSMGEWEMIVVENHSSDDGPAQVGAMAAVDSRIRLVRAPESVRGPGTARNLGFELVSGEWILFLDADDLIEPDHLSALCEVGRTGAADIVAGGWKEFVEGNHLVCIEREGPVEMETAESVLNRSLACAPWAVHAALIRRDWLTHERLWPMEMERHPSEDSVFWFRALQGARLGVSKSKGAIYRKETAGHRDCHEEIERWAQAVLEVIRLNDDWLVRMDRRPSPRQAACVVRTLEQLYKRCHEARHHKCAERVIIEAERWLSLTSFRSPGLAIRRILGIRSFGALRRSTQ
jgi:glycosyltransferase involved in cell wall biosynthesis